MATVHARDVSFSFGAGPVLAGVDLGVAPGQRIGVVGPNGTGKSTLLRLLAGQLRPEAGAVTVAPPTATVGLLPQEPDRRADESVAGFIARRTGVAAATAELEVATTRLAAGEPGADDRYADALDRWLGLGGPDLDARIGSTLADLGLDGRLVDQPTATPSGGEAARVGLAATLLSRFDVFLLDEPTNDLDFVGLARLESFLLELGAATVVVSHDRAFLARVVTHVLDLDEHARTGRLYAGGWDAYLADRATARRHAEEAFGAYQAKRSALTERARTQREWSVQGVKKAKRSGETDKFIRFKNTADSEKVAHKAKATERAMERLDEVEKPWEGWELRFDIGTAARSGDVVASLRGAVVERGAFRLGPVDLEVGWAERVAILGDNGAGKSTLLDALLGRATLTAGTSHVGPGVVVGELGQRRDRFATDRSLLEVVGGATGQPVNEVRSLLAKFGLGADHVARPSAQLSPGERTRANLALFMAEGVNCLVLDEPTNHLDLVAIEQLEQALGRYVGTLLLVTHDRRFLERVPVTRRLQVAGGLVTELG
ncbi:MAG TPA: ABC-F family ATP-binding cassette domain-containing protein [Aquihabitans sp.]|jgi:ATPase subunit of ABC transporter with duplicated ATPase domains|nr:ABC-F family ATP-binding cassette domain-containing protein [Aquihabitans sp.]